MLTRLVDLLISWVERLAFWWTIHAYERGVVLRFGRFHRALEPGFHCVFPMFEQVLVDNVVPRTVNLRPQSLTTKDGVQVVVSGVLTYAIRDIKVFLLEIESADTLLADSAYGMFAELVRGQEYEELRTGDLPALMTAELRKVAWRWGVDVKKVTLSDFAKARSYRLWGAGKEVAA